MEANWIDRVVASPARDPDVAYLRARYRDDFQKAVDEAVRSLEPRARAVMRLPFGQGLTLEQIGTSYGVNRSSVSRWIDSAAGQVLSASRALLTARLKINDSELDSLLRDFMSDMELSLGRALRES